MSPMKIAAQAQRAGIALVAICDHNSSENVPAVMKAAGRHALVVLPGMEICTKEEIHVLAIFGGLEEAFQMQSIVYDHLPGKNDPEVFGLQVVANERDEVLAFQERLLIGAADLPVEQIVCTIHHLGGIAVASHIDREAYSVISQLGFIPAELRFDALELSPHISSDGARDRFGSYAAFTFVRNSDAHFLGDVGKNTCAYLLERPTFEEIRKALRNEDGRMVCGV